MIDGDDASTAMATALADRGACVLHVGRRFAETGSVTLGSPNPAISREGAADWVAVHALEFIQLR